MIQYLRQYRLYITLFVFVLIPILALDTQSRSPKEFRFADRWIVGLTSPLQTAISWILDRGVDVAQNYLFLLSVRRENTALLEENRRLLASIVSLSEEQLENRRLRKLLKFQEEFQISQITARVIGKDASSEFRSVRINRGEAAGIRKDMAVVTADGVVGRVVRTAEHTADVVTILDLLSATDVISKRSRARGIVEGMTDELCQLKFALRTDDLEPGDLLITSGLGGIFPRGVPVGVVSQVKRPPYGITQEVEVRPNVDFSKLEEVQVITSFASS